MQEYTSQAIILKSEPYRELDTRASLFTQKFGKVEARARSARKITSKLAAHLEPGIFTSVRLIEKSGVQVVDALKSRTSGLPLADLGLLADLLPPFQPEAELWQMLSTGTLMWAKTLKILGWDPAQASCAQCRANEPSHFRVSNQDFFCAHCASQLSGNGLIYLSSLP